MGRSNLVMADGRVDAQTAVSILRQSAGAVPTGADAT